MGFSKQPKTNASPSIRIFFYALLVIACLSVPTVLTLNMTATPQARVVAAVVATGGLALLLLGLVSLGRTWRGLLWLYPILTGLMLIRLMQFGAVDFSGAGFTDEFFLHFGIESASVAIQEYDRAIAVSALLLAIIFAATRGITKQSTQYPSRMLAVLCLAGLVSVLVGRASLPEWQFIQAYKDWRNPLTILESTDQTTRNQLIDAGLLEIDLAYKQQVTATLPSQPKNVIVLYLESVGVNLATQANWPALMPNFAQLLNEHAWVDHLWASSYITIEGLTNTQCGTLVPFAQGSESIAAGEGLADSLPCVGDVLNVAGYHQVFLGGAETTFAGKGAFLSRHGFDEVYGLEHWRAQGLNSRPNTWGLSDPDLFEQSLMMIDTLRAQPKPWHMTMLTIGTHLPGYLYEECQPYRHGDAEFLHALHCTDQLLGQWVETLRSKGVLEDTVLVITADHQVFPNPEMKRLFGDDVYDRRLPMIVLGPVSQQASVRSGAGYDFAPTLLDLLEIEHDARFVLGRPLTRDIDRPDYFVTRYSDFFNGQRVSNASDCEAEDALPLNACQKRELLSILSLISEQFSSPTSKLVCGFDYIYTPASDSGLIEIMVGGNDQSQRFTRGGRPVNIRKPGWAMLFLDDTGEVVSRSFIPETRDSNERLLALDEALSTSTSQILVWTGSKDASQLPWFDPPSTSGAHAWWINSAGQVIAESALDLELENAGIKALRFDRATCQNAIDLGALVVNWR